MERKRPLDLFRSARVIGRFPMAGFGRWIFGVEDDSTLVELKLLGSVWFIGDFPGELFGH